MILHQPLGDQHVAVVDAEQQLARRPRPRGAQAATRARKRGQLEARQHWGEPGGNRGGGVRGGDCGGRGGARDDAIGASTTRQINSQQLLRSTVSNLTHEPSTRDYTPSPTWAGSAH
eukprot:scaffold50716_cov63-Phaeocystis_antarctica.AAC.2